MDVDTSFMTVKSKLVKVTPSYLQSELVGSEYRIEAVIYWSVLVFIKSAVPPISNVEGVVNG